MDLFVFLKHFPLKRRSLLMILFHDKAFSLFYRWALQSLVYKNLFNKYKITS